MRIYIEESRINTEGLRINPEDLQINTEGSQINTESSQINPEASQINNEASQIYPEASQINPEDLQIYPEAPRLSGSSDTNRHHRRYLPSNILEPQNKAPLKMTNFEKGLLINQEFQVQFLHIGTYYLLSMVDSTQYLLLYLLLQACLTSRA